MCRGVGLVRCRDIVSRGRGVMRCRGVVRCTGVVRCSEV